MPEGTPTPEETAPKGGDEGTLTPKPDTKPTDEGKAPKWEGEFDPERAARLVENLRADLAKRDSALETLKAQIAAKGEGEKSLQERLAALEERNAKAERDLMVAKVVKAHEVPDDLIEFLTAKTEEGLVKQAEKLAARAARESADGLPGKPKPRLKTSAGESDPDTFDPEAVAKAARRR